MTPERKRILTEFVAVQCFQMPNEPAYFNDECFAIGYGKQTLHDVGMTKSEFRRHIMELRNEGLVELMPCIDEDGVPHGSGYFLTKQGIEYVNHHFSIEELSEII